MRVPVRVDAPHLGYPVVGRRVHGSKPRGLCGQRGSGTGGLPDSKGPPQTAAHLEILQEQDSDECCPNLDMYRIGAGSHEGFDFQVLFDGFEEEFDLPALLVDGGNRVGDQFHVVCQQDDLALTHRIPNYHPAQLSTSNPARCGKTLTVRASTHSSGTSSSIWSCSPVSRHEKRGAPTSTHSSPKKSIRISLHPHKARDHTKVFRKLVRLARSAAILLPGGRGYGLGSVKCLHFFEAEVAGGGEGVVSLVEEHLVTDTDALHGSRDGGFYAGGSILDDNAGFSGNAEESRGE